MCVVCVVVVVVCVCGGVCVCVVWCVVLLYCRVDNKRVESSERSCCGGVGGKEYLRECDFGIFAWKKQGEGLVFVEQFRQAQREPLEFR